MHRPVYTLSTYLGILLKYLGGVGTVFSNCQADPLLAAHRCIRQSCKPGKWATVRATAGLACLPYLPLYNNPIIGREPPLFLVPVSINGLVHFKIYPKLVDTHDIGRRLGTQPGGQPSEKGTIPHHHGHYRQGAPRQCALPAGCSIG
jgi:hypothetical protein